MAEIDAIGILCNLSSRRCHNRMSKLMKERSESAQGEASNAGLPAQAWPVKECQGDESDSHWPENRRHPTHPSLEEDIRNDTRHETWRIEQRAKVPIYMWLESESRGDCPKGKQRNYASEPGGQQETKRQQQVHLHFDRKAP